MAATRFNIFTGLLKAYDGPDGSKNFRTTASSTITDLAGDEILPPAIEKMAEKAKGNLTIFLNHEYRVPEDVLGSVTAANMQTRGVDGDGNPVVDLDFDIKVNDSNPRALQTYEAIKAGVRLGTSIGAIVRHAEKKKGGGLRIDDVELLEASIVGIPANPRSWVQYAVKAINKDPSVLLSVGNGIPDEALDEPVIEDEKTADAPDIGKIVEAGMSLDDIVNAEIVDETGEPDVEPDKEAAATCPDCGGSAGSPKGDCSNPMHNRKDAPEPEVTEADPDKEAARTRVTVTVDSDAAQEAPKSEPGLAVTDEDRTDTPTDEATAALGDVTREASGLVIDKADLPTVVKQLSDLATKFADLQEKYATEKEKRIEAEENLVAAKAIFDRIADLPVGRKTHFSGAVQDFRKRFPQYDDEFMKILEK